MAQQQLEQRKKVLESVAGRTKGMTNNAMSFDTNASILHEKLDKEKKEKNSKLV